MLFGNIYHSLFLMQLQDTDDNELNILITQSKRVKPSRKEIAVEKDKNIRKILSKSMSIVPDYTQMYRIYFESYIIYQGRNESYAYNKDDDHISVGQGLVLFEKSKLLDYVHHIVEVPVAMHMWQQSKLHHFGIYALNNIVDVVTFHKPVIEKIDQIV